ncbi:MAG: hypothetical protein QOG88_455 [Actinomycetota bacterium]|nr:hypothetical protein [Actinomycetota bacterium]
MRMVPQRAVAHVALIAAIGLGLAACSSSSSSSTPTTDTTTTAPTGTGDVGVAEKDFAISLDSSSAPAGKVTFTVANAGPSVHEFVVFKTDLPEDQLPTDSKGDVDESGTGVTHIDEIEDIAAGSTDSTLKVDLESGSYVLICNLPGHYGLGMHASFTVEG